MDSSRRHQQGNRGGRRQDIEDIYEVAILTESY